MKPFGISVHLIEPGMYKTDILNPKTITNGLKKNWDDTDEEMKKEYGEPYFNECKCSSLSIFRTPGGAW